MRLILILFLVFTCAASMAQSFAEITSGSEQEVKRAIEAARADGVRYKAFFGLHQLGTIYLNNRSLWRCDSVLTVMETEFADVIKRGKAHWQRLNVASYYQLLSAYYMLKSDHAKAKALLRHAQRIDRNIYSFSNSMFPLYVREGKLDSAEMFLQSSFPRIARDLDINKFDFELLNDFQTAFRNMCELKILQGDMHGFEFYLFKWLNIRKGTLNSNLRMKRKYSTFTDWQMVYLSRYLMMKGDAAAASKVLGQVKGLTTETKVEKLRTEAQLHYYTDNYDGAIAALRQVLENHKENVRQYFPQFTELERESYINKLNDDYDFFITAVTAKGAPDENHLLQLFEFQLFRKGLLLDVTRRLNKAGTVTNTPEGRALSQRIAALDDSIALYSFKNKPPKTGESKEVFLQRLNRQRQQYEKALLLLVSKESGDLITEHKTSEITNMLPPAACLVELIRFQKRVKHPSKLLATAGAAYVMVVISRDSSPAYRLIADADELETRYARLYRNVMTGQLSDPRLYERFWGMIEPAVASYKQVFLSPDGIYNVLNVNTLQNPVTGRYVLDETQIINITSPKDILDDFDRKTVNKAALLVGYPLYSYSATTPQQAVTVRGSVLQELENIKSSEFPVLPGTHDEVQRIGALIRGRNGRCEVLEREEASEQMLKAAVIPDILHIATHGFFISSGSQVTNPLLQSGLVLAGVSNKGVEDQTGHDGVLTALEISALDLTQTKLVVLSACETGLGEVKNGDGVYGLQRAFRLAEAKYVVLSLWKVDDEATMKLMELFYSKLMDSNDVVLSFNTAQKELRKLYPEPYYWGAFRLIGY